MNLKKVFLLFCMVISFFAGRSQEVEIVCQQQALNSLLVDLREKYQIQLSFDDNYLAQFKISAAKKFTSPQRAFDFILKDLPIAYEKVGGVFLFYQKLPEPVVKNYLLNGHFSDRKSLESLPYTHLVINKTNLVTDQEGNFAFVSHKDSLFHVQASYLGYFLLDTLVKPATFRQFTLTSTNYKIEEIEVKGLRVVKSLQVGNNPGVLRLNHLIAKYLPGNSDNSVFNLLRLQPGILAAGEQSNDLVIWGSYEGQTQILFDGFTLFGMKNFNDNISAVNPFMAKDIQVLKGAYDAKHGGRVGGIVNITGADGDVHTARLNSSINNMTLNGMLSIPIAGQSALTVAFRQTYYELYDTKQLSFRSGRSGKGSGTSERLIYPDYNFHDFNLKYSGKSKTGDSYSISSLYGEDRFSYTLDTENERSRIGYEDHEHNKQLGGSAFYQKIWENGSRTKLSAAYSTLNKELRNLRKVGFRPADTGTGSDGSGGSGSGHSGSGGETGGQGDFDTVINQDMQSVNRITEANFSVSHHWILAEKHQFEFGTSAIFNRINFQEDSFQVRLADQKFEGSRLNGYLQESYSVTPWMELNLGVRANYSLNLERFYIQPRISSGIRLGGGFKINAAWGLHNQFISRSSLIDEEGNYHFLWTVCDNQAIPVIESRHLILGFTYTKNEFTFSLEGFDKKTSGLTRYVDNFSTTNLYKGDSKSQGLDFFIKQEYRGHSAWISYTLSQTSEKFDYFTVPEYSRALHDQRHELKTAVLLNFNPFHFSANYVFGSGFPDPRQSADGNTEQNYNRLDVSATYTLAAKKVTLEGGISILNVLNNDNLKYANFIRVPEDQETWLDLQAKAIPLTPTVFLHFSF
ncbi:MAG TPA: TonB-dependent receptor plug domain-containing protein [Prolixibacteraceae bacterium]|nr:TonB-dependent receptor plug domain-containing protein [Prolixibacteraceae bacterium]